ncbi:MAG: VIT family protein [Jatrophihabitans sp.]|nr:MAG: VIT family protein [Jatrophihabitans sp.]
MTTASSDSRHAGEPHRANASGRLNWLRAGVLGANDGVVSIAGLVVGVAGATTSRTAILAAGVAGLIAGAVSMALGEYVSVSSQRDSERAMLERERRELRDDPEAEIAELAAIYRSKGLRRSTAETVARELSAHDAFAAHAEAELGISPGALVNPWHAAGASGTAFTVGAVIPLATMLLPMPAAARVPVTIAAVLGALVLAGSISARLGGSSVRTAVVRLVLGGLAGLLFTYGVGVLFGHTVG